MLIPLIALLAGVLLGLFFPYHISAEYSQYAAIAILTSLDSIFGGLSAVFQKTFNLKIFLTGFVGNAALAILLVYLGKRLDLDIYLVAVIVFGTRLFQNFAIIRRFILNKFTK